jgi:hypothetical protein
MSTPVSSLKVHRRGSGDVHGLFDVENVSGLGGSPQQMLRPLENKVPPQVREAEDIHDGSGIQTAREMPP